MLAFIWAEDQNHLIGQNGHLPWHLPSDLHYLKKTTLNTTIVMGYRTFRSFPNGALPQRKNIVLTHQTEKLQGQNVLVAQNKAEIERLIANDQQVFIFGGRSLFEMFLPEVGYLYVTKIAHTFVGDTWMIPIDYQQFTLIDQKKGIVDDNNTFKHEFLVYRRLTNTNTRKETLKLFQS
ncbi:dihydrofolate reductase [Bombilactobacillus thymidiniphilus]|uniref:dihydrofolate reductase n=1 Tax=Bombilactobacillus thymidiniphilus TaxID=2923363 RepID=A0ABY4PD58_9LACO|nr:dihydrofolate reductase [Bombilactobacillus thymidiniphilus]UQS83713.1 dihydrofolate reductase [Bombilactobacillus thymidiniphilus]